VSFLLERQRSPFSRDLEREREREREKGLPSSQKSRYADRFNPRAILFPDK